MGLEPVTRLLIEAGHEAIAVDLPGDDETAGLARYPNWWWTRSVHAPGLSWLQGRWPGSLRRWSASALASCELVLVNAMIPDPGETARDWWAHTGALQAREEAALAGGYRSFDLATYFLHDVDPEIVAEGERYQRAEAEVAFESVCDFTAWPATGTRVLVGADDRFFPAGLQRRVALTGSASSLT